jgi:hypothetical protein
MVGVDGQLVQEHLGALIRVGCLHAADEADGVVVVNGDQQMMALARQELRGPGLRRRSIEEEGAGENDGLVAGS